MTTIRIITTSAGHYKIIVERDNYSPKTRYWTSTTRWTHTTTDSMSVDDYRSDDMKRYKRGARNLIWQARTWGTKELIKR